MSWSRREVLGGVGALAVTGCADRAPAPTPGALLHEGDAALGHKVRSPFVRPTPGETEEADVVIVGAGAAGVCAAWRLASAGFSGSVLRLELGESVGGTAAWGEGSAGPFALGAHYLTLPSPEAQHMRALLAALGVITGFDAQGRPFFDDAAICLAPDERLFLGGTWIDGLWPEGLATAEDTAQLQDFLAVCDQYRGMRGADGRPAFAIPVAHCSADPALRALAALSYADWMDAQGYTAPALRASLAYDTRDDFGAPPERISAWAGLHYHCARRPDPADATDLGTNVLTWPAGNGWLIQQLEARIPWRARVGQLVRRIEPEGDRTRLWIEGEARSIRAKAVIAAVPSRVLDRLLDRPAVPERPDMAPWRIAALQCDQPPASRGVPLAWDSVIYGARGLGYVSSAHQQGRYGGPTVLTWYEPLDALPPAAARGQLLAMGRAEIAHAAMSELAPAHPDLGARVQRIDALRWGHGTVIPRVGLHADPATLAALAEPVGAVFPAHTDLSGMGLFEEASWHGIRAAEAVLDALGQDPGPLLTGAG